MVMEEEANKWLQQQRDHLLPAQCTIMVVVVVVDILLRL